MQNELSTGAVLGASRPVGVSSAYLPVNTGTRFSAMARIPSR